MKNKGSEIYLSKKEILLFFKATNSDINYLVKRKLLKPISIRGQIVFGLENIMNATFHLTKEVKNKI